jgi:DMSO/TMAO reductase YedYZ molybdopterin-dependent catalytic subunit
MNQPVLLRITGEVEQPASLTFADLAAIAAERQIADVSHVASKRRGSAVTLEGVLALAHPKPSARWLGLHSESDNFHASIPLDAVRSQAFLIYKLDGEPLPAKAGGPVRFFIPDHAACHTEEIDECANVKFVERIELTSEKGFDNRPSDEEEHHKLHGGA